MKSRGFTLIELLAMIALLGVLAAIMLPAFGRSREARRRAICFNNLKQMGIVFKMYWGESRGEKWPPARPFCCDPDDPIIRPVRDEADPNCTGLAMIPNVYALYPEYMNDPSLLLCPSGKVGVDPAKVFNAADNMVRVMGQEWTKYESNTKPSIEWSTPAAVATPGVPNKEFYPCEVDASTSSYLYTAWRFDLADFTDVPAPPLTGDVDADVASLWKTNPGLCEIMRTFLDRLAWGTSGLDISDVSPKGAARLLDSDISVPGLATPQRLRMIHYDHFGSQPPPTGRSTIWVMMDRISADGGGQFNHKPAGANVLYMDGHVEFVRYGDKWPVDAKMALLQSQAFYDSVFPPE